MESEMEAMSGETDSDDDFMNMIESDGSIRYWAPVSDQLLKLLLLVLYQLPSIRLHDSGFSECELLVQIQNLFSPLMSMTTLLQYSAANVTGFCW